MPNHGLRLKEPAIAGYVYNPPQTPPFEKEGLVVALCVTLPMAGVVNGLKDIIDIREFREINEIKDYAIS